MSKPIRILHILHGLGTGGAESVIMNWYRHIDRNKVQFDFLIRSERNVYAEEISEYGGRVFIMPPYPSRYFANKQATVRFFKEHAKDYAGIHVHGNALLYVNVFAIARKYGINQRAYHSHSTSTSFAFRLLHMFNRLRIKKLATDFFACSKAAGKWAFGEQSCIVVNNGIDTERFAYSESIRNQMRTALGISNETVYGHVGRFVQVKNHAFLLDAFEKIVQKEENSILLLLGDGELTDEIKKLAQAKGIDQKIHFLGRQKNVADFMNAMDVFMLPSLHEGLPVAVVEAQAAGLPCVLSDAVPGEVEITECVRFLPISDSEAWAQCALEMRHLPRGNTRDEIRKAGYDIELSTKFLEDHYCSWR